MSTTTPAPHSPLDDLGDALLAATTADLLRTQHEPRRRRKLAAALVAAAIAVPSAALAANALITTDDVEKSIPSGTLVLMGTSPSCTTIRANVEFDCVLSTLPKQGDIAAGGWKGTVEPTVDSRDRVNGGCRSLNADGTHWRCYVGEAAVRERIIGADFLGQDAPKPAAG